MFCSILSMGFLCTAYFVYNDSGKRESVSVMMPAAESRNRAEPELCAFSQGLDIVSSRCTGLTAGGRRTNPAWPSTWTLCVWVGKPPSLSAPLMADLYKEGLVALHSDDKDRDCPCLAAGWARSALMADHLTFHFFHMKVVLKLDFTCLPPVSGEWSALWACPQAARLCITGSSPTYGSVPPDASAGGANVCQMPPSAPHASQEQGALSGLVPFVCVSLVQLLCNIWHLSPASLSLLLLIKDWVVFYPLILSKYCVPF